MSSILENNLAALELRFPELYDYCLKKTKEPSLQNNVYTEQSQDNEIVVAVEKNGHRWYLGSRYNSGFAARCWWDRLEVKDNINYKALVNFFGMGNLAAVNIALADLGDENRIFLYEPDEDIFMALVKNVDITYLINDGRVFLFVGGVNDALLGEIIISLIDYPQAKYTHILISLAYSYVYREEAEEFMKVCSDALSTIYVQNNTFTEFGEEIGDNIIDNIWQMGKASSVNQFKEYFENKFDEIDKIPVIIVSAGPSLDKNIEDLKAAKGKALIVAVDSSIKKMVEHEIIPDMVITVDPHKPMQLFEDERARNVPIIFCGQSRHDIIEKHTGKGFTYISDKFSMMFFDMFNKAVTVLQTGGSVANTAFSFLEYAGFRRIILVGQDLAFTDNKKHASDLYDEKEIGEDDEDSYTYVEDIYGNQLMTFVNFKIYKDWFETRIKNNEELEVLNATEGGANIKGAENVTLKEAIDRYCVNELGINLLEIDDLFSDEELELYYGELLKLESRCDQLENVFNEGISAYDRLHSRLEEGTLDSAEYGRINKIIDRVNSVDKQEPLMILVSLYSSKEETDILSSIYEETDDLKAAINVAKQGKLILCAYKKALVRIKDRLDNLIKYEASQDVYEITEYSILVSE